jgi:hypothetical protein
MNSSNESGKEAVILGGQRAPLDGPATTGFTPNCSLRHPRRPFKKHWNGSGLRYRHYWSDCGAKSRTGASVQDTGSMAWKEASRMRASTYRFPSFTCSTGMTHVDRIDRRKGLLAIIPHFAIGGAATARFSIVRRPKATSCWLQIDWNASISVSVSRGGWKIGWTGSKSGPITIDPPKQSAPDSHPGH